MVNWPVQSLMTSHPKFLMLSTLVSIHGFYYMSFLVRKFVFSIVYMSSYRLLISHLLFCPADDQS